MARPLSTPNPAQLPRPTVTAEVPLFRPMPWKAPLRPSGLILGGLFFLAAVQPSLIPRSGPVQGALAGLSFVAGYGIAALVAGMLGWLGLRGESWLSTGTQRILRLAGLIPIAAALWLATAYQNSLHHALGLPPVETVRPLILLVVAVGLAAVLILFGRLFGHVMAMAANRLLVFAPRRLAILAAALLALLLFWSVGDRLVVRQLLRLADSIYQRIDALDEAEAPPQRADQSGSAASLLSWDELGRQGRLRVLAAPNAAAITAVTGRPALEPLRIFVGLRHAETPQARAELALAEMQRVGALDRKVLVIATPTGTGWVDPAGMAPVEFLAGGDIASVSVQYSYLPSWLSLFVEPEYGAETAKAVFQAVHGHWHSLPPDQRPALYLFGLSLGALNSDLSADNFDLVNDPYQGAVWAGPPFASRTWPEIRDGRLAGTPSWAPRFRDGSVVRFTTQTDLTGKATAPWGRMRIVYLAYPSDPIVHFQTSMALWKPDWYDSPRAPDVSERLTWVPVVSFLQVAFDMMLATTTPVGTGHVYKAEHYLAAWQAVLAPADWTEANQAALIAWLAAQGL
ncbi:alpha/beta hydrolase [Neogemmobacter tilapiae]|uniref:Membrane protein n=1 Tax=Neogemmobacter tilapiae TaxID=875041 RepID=A0A918TV32_9RHOB|nr:alpha/beta-hydrolase family protein [Gemmobacter tilapiae]GHC63268.1 membrane protein [Gemmobacter tilapiae]